jgi:hypothetical protein
MNFKTTQDGEAAEGAQELTDALEPGDATFVTGEPKKRVSAGTLGILGLLAACAGGTYLMYLRGGPQAANAADVAAADEIGTFLNEGEKHVALMKQMLQNTDKVVQQFRQSSVKTQIPLAGLAANPFRMEAIKASNPTESDAASRRRRDEERAAVVQAARAMKLESIMYGEARRAAMINGQLVLEGQEVDSLTVEKIFPDRVILRSGVYRVEKPFQK